MAKDRFPRVFRGPVGQPVHVQLAFQYAIVRSWAKRGYEARFGCFLALTRPLQADKSDFAHFFALFSCRSVWLDFRRSLPVDVDFNALRQDTVTEVGFMALSWYMCDTTRDTVGPSLPRLDFRRGPVLALDKSCPARSVRSWLCPGVGRRGRGAMGAHGSY